MIPSILLKSVDPATCIVFARIAFRVNMDEDSFDFLLKAASLPYNFQKEIISREKKSRMDPVCTAINSLFHGKRSKRGATP